MRRICRIISRVSTTFTTPRRWWSRWWWVIPVWCVGVALIWNVVWVVVGVIWLIVWRGALIVIPLLVLGNTNES